MRKLSAEMVNRIAAGVANDLERQGGGRFKSDRPRILAAIAATVQAELNSEDDLERKARELLEAHMRSAPPGIDRAKMLQMIRRKLADEG